MKRPQRQVAAGGAERSEAMERQLLLPGAEGRRQVRVATNDPLLRAYYDGNKDKLQEIIEQSPKELERHVDGINPLACLAAKEDRDDVLTLLSLVEADMTIRNRMNMNPLQMAVLNASLAATNYLTYEKSNDVNEPYPNGDYLLHRGCMNAEANFVRLLLSVGADANNKNAQGHLPLHKACEEESVEMAALLLPKTDDVNGCCNDGRTPLHIAAANQSLALIKLLLAYGADIDRQDAHRETPIDIVMQMGNKNITVGLAKFLDLSVPGEFLSPRELAESEQFVDIIQFLQTIDNEMLHPTMGKRTDTSEEEVSRIIGRIATEEKMDFMEFRTMMTTIVQANLSAKIEECGIVDKLAVAVCKQILFREDAEMLRLLIYGTTLWPAIRDILEEDIFLLYETCQEIGSTGMVGLIKHETFDEEGNLDIDDFCLFVAQISTLPTLDVRKDKLRNQFLKDPLKTLTLWSVLTGRFDLTEDLLKAEQFDIIPMGLFCATILRNVRVRPQIPSPTKKIMEEVADKCESVVVKLLRGITEHDTSENKRISMQYMRCPLYPYSNKSAIDLAAEGQSERFITMPSVQNALDMEWYDKLYHMPWLLRQFLVLMSLIPYNPIVALILHRLDERRRLEAEAAAAIEEEEEAAEVVGLRLGSELTKKEKTSRDDGDKRVFSKKDFNTDARRKQLKKNLSVAQDSDEKRKDERAAGQEMEMGALGERGDYDSRTSLLPGERRSRGKSKRPDPGSQPRRSLLRKGFSIMNKLYNTPCVKFRFHVMAHIIFVILFSIVIVANFRYQISPMEVVVYLFLCGFLLEELREANMALNSGTMSSYLSDGWNLIDNSAISLGIIGFCMRLMRVNKMMAPTDLYAFTDSFWWFTHLTLATSCLLFWIRLLYISTVLESLGPKLKMIYIMIIRDFLPFLIILSIFMFGFGIAIHGLLFPNGYALNNSVPLTKSQIFKRMFRITFYAMVGDYSLDLIEGNDCSNTSTLQPCPHPLGQVVVLNGLMVVYIVITTVLLLNLIISLFSKTVEEVDKKSFALWQFERYNLVHEFHIRFPLPPPLNILGSVFKRISSVFSRFKARGRHTVQKAERGFDKTSVFHFLLFQAFTLRKRRKHLQGDIEVEDMEMIIGEINSNVHQMNSELNNIAKWLSSEK